MGLRKWKQDLFEPQGDELRAHERQRMIHTRGITGGQYETHIMPSGTGQFNTRTSKHTLLCYHIR